MAKAKDISAPFDKGVLDAARRIVEAYDIVLRWEEDEWYGHALEYPEAMGDGKTPIDNLYLGGACIHPGGGILGACGYIAAGTVLADLNIEPWW